MIPRWIVTRIKISRGILTPGRDSTLNCDTESWFHIELWPTLNCNVGLGSQFNVEFWPGVIIQRGILTRGHNSTWNSDPSTYLPPVELRLKKVSKFNSVIKIQQLRGVIIQRKIHWKLTSGWYSITGTHRWFNVDFRSQRWTTNFQRWNNVTDFNVEIAMEG